MAGEGVLTKREASSLVSFSAVATILVTCTSVTSRKNKLAKSYENESKKEGSRGGGIRRFVVVTASVSGGSCVSVVGLHTRSSDIAREYNNVVSILKVESESGRCSHETMVNRANQPISEK